MRPPPPTALPPDELAGQIGLGMPLEMHAEGGWWEVEVLGASAGPCADPSDAAAAAAAEPTTTATFPNGAAADVMYTVRLMTAPSETVGMYEVGIDRLRPGWHWKAGKWAGIWGSSGRLAVAPATSANGAPADGSAPSPKRQRQAPSGGRGGGGRGNGERGGRRGGKARGRGGWASADDEEALRVLRARYPLGSKVEVMQVDSGLDGSWFSGEVIGHTAPDLCLVRYDELHEGDDGEDGEGAAGVQASKREDKGEAARARAAVEVGSRAQSAEVGSFTAASNIRAPQVEPSAVACGHPRATDDAAAAAPATAVGGTAEGAADGLATSVAVAPAAAEAPAPAVEAPASAVEAPVKMDADDDEDEVIEVEDVDGDEPMPFATLESGGHGSSGDGGGTSGGHGSSGDGDGNGWKTEWGDPSEYPPLYESLEPVSRMRPIPPGPLPGDAKHAAWASSLAPGAALDLMYDGGWWHVELIQMAPPTQVPEPPAAPSGDTSLSLDVPHVPGPGHLFTVRAVDFEVEHTVPADELRQPYAYDADSGTWSLRPPPRVYIGASPAKSKSNKRGRSTAATSPKAAKPASGGGESKAGEPVHSANHFVLGTRRKGTNGSFWEVDLLGGVQLWVPCTSNAASSRRRDRRGNAKEEPAAEVAGECHANGVQGAPAMEPEAGEHAADDAPALEGAATDNPAPRSAATEAEEEEGSQADAEQVLLVGNVHADD